MKRSLLFTAGLIMVILLVSSCASKMPYSKEKGQDMADVPASLRASNVDYELFFIGDAGSGTSASSVVDMVASQLSPSNDHQGVVFLGNVLPESGLPASDDPDYDVVKSQVESYFNKINKSTDNIFFIPGNNEWYDGSDMTVAAMQASEDFIQEIAGEKNVVIPSKGCGEPVKLDLTEELVLVLTDSQWALQGDDNTQRKRSGCDIDNTGEYVTYIADILARNKRRNVIIAAHHPVLSNGKIGGNYPVGSHLLPLPVVGTLVTGFKKIMGGEQRFGHPHYDAYRAAIGSALQNFEGVTYISGHDHSLQYHESDANHYVVSGSAAKVDYARKGDGADFAYMSKGFSKIIHTKDHELWLEFYVPDDTKQGKLIYRKMIYKKPQINFNDKSIFKEDRSKRDYTIAASKLYSEHKLIGGKLYRDEWGQDIVAPALFLDETYGGLRPVQQGGGFQTRSLRLENDQGQQWVLRSINKDVTKVVPAGLRSSFVKSLVQDGIGAAHPYGAFVIPKLAEAAGIYHSNPKYVYLPHQKALGDYDTDFAERLYLFEERPGGNASAVNSYGNPEKTINTPDLLEKIMKSHKHVIDQQWTLRSRLFDVWIGDWDRHDDQWRWARFKEDDRTLYRPIPRDRDQVFFKNDGLVNYLSSRPFVGPQLRKFEAEVDYMPGLIFNARYFDRSFLNQMTREDFRKAALELQENLTDDIIDEAFQAWPEEIYALNGDNIKAKLRQRRTDWVKYALEFYDIIAENVDVVGTRSDDIFEVKLLPDDQMDVKVYRLTKDGKKHLTYSRIIRGDETKEVRLFGLKKADQFDLSGDHDSSIKLRIIGGGGSDMVVNRAGDLKPIVYDKPNGISIEGNPVKSKIADRKGINKYDRKDYQLNSKITIPLITFYTDEGVGISMSRIWKSHGFRSDPFKSSQSISASYFFKNKAVLAAYTGYFPKALGQLDFKLGVDFKGPAFTQFFYGIGNTYNNLDSAITYHIVKGTDINVRPSIIKPLANDQSISITPSYQYLNLKNSDDDPRFIFNEAGIPAEQLSNKNYVGLGIGYHNTRIDNAVIPKRGYVFDIGAEYKFNIDDSDINFLRLSTNLAAYIPFSQRKTVVLAMNIGGAYNFGDYEFYHANYLSSPSRLRGFRSNRFAGDGIAYHATDLRIKLLEGKGGFPLGLGVFGSFDYGRAFLENDLVNSDTWHTSYGGGLYITPLGMIGMKFGYYVGEDDTQISLGGALSF